MKKELTTKKKIIFFLLAIILSAMTGLFTAELILRMFFPQQEAMRWYESDEKYGYVLKKNFYQKYHFIGSDFIMEVKTNSLGLRAKEYNLSRTDAKRILLLGDSFVFGHGVNIEDRLDTKLEELLNQSNDNFIVINSGVDGWGTFQEITYAKDNFDLFNPDIIVITFCGNDPDDDISFIYKMKDNEKGVLNFPGKIFLRNHSHLYRFIYDKYHKILHNFILKRKIAENYNKNENVEIDKQTASIITEQEWNVTLRYINNFHKDFLEFKPNGVLLLQATAPWDIDIREHLSLLSQGENLIYVDLYNDAILLEPGQRRLPYDGHWSPLMHSISASKLFKIIINLYKNAAKDRSLTKVIN